MKSNIFSIFGKKPKIGGETFVDPASRIVGDVHIGRNCAILYGTVIRGDDDSVRIGNNVAILENCIIEAPEGHPVYIGDNSIISHGAIIHGAKIGYNVLIGIGAIILDGASVGDNSIVAAGTVIPPGKRIENNMLVIGVPGKPIRKVTAEELERVYIEREKVLQKSKEYNRIFKGPPD